MQPFNPLEWRDELDGVLVAEEVLDDVEIMGDLLTDSLGSDDILDGEDDDVLSGLFDSIAKVAGGAIKGVVSQAGKIIKSPITKVVGGAAALVIPPIGLPASAALVVADRAMRTIQGARKNPKAAAVVKQAMATTVKLAAKGDPDARRMVEFVAASERIRNTNAKRTRAPRARGTLVTRKNGKLVIERGDWSKA